MLGGTLNVSRKLISYVRGGILLLPNEVWKRFTISLTSVTSVLFLLKYGLISYGILNCTLIVQTKLCEQLSFAYDSREGDNLSG